MLNETQNEMFAAFVRKVVDDQWELVHLLDGLDAGDLAALAPEEKEAVSALVNGMRALFDGIRDGLRDGEWSASGSPGLGASIEDLQQRVEEIRSAIRDDRPA